jgi:PIN domain nuclease of toxin-antitoxin system
MKGEIEVGADFDDPLPFNFTVDVTQQHAFAVAQLPHHHRDPFDRMLVAQAWEELTLLTHDETVAHYPSTLLV